MTSVEEAGQHIDRLLAQLRDSPDPLAAEAAGELAGRLVQLYGDGLARIAALLGADRLTELSTDPLVASLLLVHDLHPVPAADRIRQALAGTGAEFLGIDEAGLVRLRVTAPRRGAAREIETVVRRVAPEVSGVDLVALPPLLQVSLRPGLAPAMHGDS
jgi:hypothetical protein